MRELDGHMLVFDVEHEEAHALDPSALLVWRQCDGATAVTEVASLLRAELNPRADEKVVWTILLELSGKHLLEESVSLRADSPGMTRRTLMVRASALAAGVAIASIAIPTASASTSVCSCKNPTDCPGCLCGPKTTNGGGLSAGCLGASCASNTDCCVTSVTQCENTSGNEGCCGHAPGPNANICIAGDPSNDPNHLCH